MDEPLIYTSKGNLPIASLEYFHEREDYLDCIVFIEGYRLNGEEVKRAAHVLPLAPRRTLWTAMRFAYQAFREIRPKKANPPVTVGISGVSSAGVSGGLN